MACGDADARVVYYSLCAAQCVEEAVVRQIEYYFSDENLPGDEFLFAKTMKRNSTAYVNISILLTFRKLKVLTSNPRFVAEAIRRRSTTLEVKANGKSVRRKQRLPGHLMDEKKRLQRCLRVDHIPPNQSVEEIEKRFGAIAPLRMVRINTESKKDAARPTCHALLEFETRQGANKALSAIKSEGWRGGIRVSRCKMELPKEESENKQGSGNNGSDQSDDSPASPVVHKGKVRSINVNERCGFIVPSPPQQGKKKVRSVYFSFDNAPSSSGLKMGDVVQYKLKKGEACEIELVESRKQASSSPNTKFMTMARGPREGSNDIGFTSEHFRGLRNRAA